MVTDLVPNVRDVKKFKQFIHGDEKTVFQPYSKDSKLECLSKPIIGKLTKETLLKLRDLNLMGMNIGMTVNQTDGMGRKNENVTQVKVLIADFDSGDKTKKEVMAQPLKPHLVVETSPGNFHDYWRIEDCPLEQFSPVMRALAEMLGSDKQVCNLSQAARIPGTLNWNHGKPVLSKIIYIDEDAKPIALKQFIKKMGLKIEAPQKAVANVGQGSQLTDEMVADIKAALTHISADDREIWRKVGMAIHSVDQTERGYKMWTEWSKNSKKFKESVQKKEWDKFKVGKGVNIETLFWLVKLFKRANGVDFDEGKLAQLFADSFKDELRYDPENGHWYNFNGVIWKFTKYPPLLKVREMLHDLAYGKKQEDGASSVQRFLTVAAFTAIVKHVQILPEMLISSIDFDKNPNLLAVQNGVINLSTGQFRQATASDYLRRQAKVEFDANAKCPEWNKFMKAVMCSNRELLEFIRQVLGYVVFGHANSQVFFLALGSGSNGKGVLMRTMNGLLGEYAVSISPNLLTTAYSGNANAPTPALAALCGARLVICTELTGRKLDGAFIKQYAGGDEITARHGYGNMFSFKPEGKLFLSANYEDLPELSATDEAMWRRFIPIPFNAKFTKGVNDDEKLDAKLAEEYPGILNWLLKGAKTYFENGLGTCAAVDDLTLKLRKEADSVLAWISECCKTKLKAKTPAGQAFTSYNEFMERQGKKPLSIQSFCAVLGIKGFAHKRGCNNNYYSGFILRK